MNGLRDYSVSERGGFTDARNLGDGRASVVGTLVHSTSGTDSLSWLISGAAQAGKPASADCLIARDGTRYNLCPPGHYPYHAGVSELTIGHSRYYGNDVSSMLLGVELECMDNQEPTYEQVDSLAEFVVVSSILWRWRWPFVVYGHYAVARPMGRRSDPVNLDWGALMGRLYVRAQQAHVAGL